MTNRTVKHPHWCRQAPSECEKSYPLVVHRRVLAVWSPSTDPDGDVALMVVLSRSDEAFEDGSCNLGDDLVQLYIADTGVEPAGAGVELSGEDTDDLRSWLHTARHYIGEPRWSHTSPALPDPGQACRAGVGVNGPRSGSRSDAVGAVEAGVGERDDSAEVGSVEPADDAHALAVAYADRCGRLTAAAEMLLEVVDELPGDALRLHREKVAYARRILADAPRTDSR